MRRCPFARCHKQIPDDKFCCTSHWLALNSSQREELSWQFREYLNERASVSQLLEVQMRILAEVQKMDFNTFTHTYKPLLHSLCPRCGSHGIECLLNHKPALFELADGPHEPLNGHELYVIIGGKPELANGSRAIYTRFKVHSCVQVEAASTTTEGNAHENGTDNRVKQAQGRERRAFNTKGNTTRPKGGNY